MTQIMNISNRLTEVASFLPTGSYFADIGSDHAYLPCYVCLQDQTAKAIAGEVNEGPYQSARQTVMHYGLSQVIDVRLGNGLEVIAKDQVTAVVIAGMGGALIRTILESGKDQLASVQRIITQPNIGERNVRKWLINNGYMIVEERIMKENDHFYEIIVADKKGQSNCLQLTDKELLFGPQLLREKSSLFIDKWRSRLDKLQGVIGDMKRATNKDKEKIGRLEQELVWIKELIDNG